MVWTAGASPRQQRLATALTCTSQRISAHQRVQGRGEGDYLSVEGGAQSRAETPAGALASRLSSTHQNAKGKETAQELTIFCEKFCFPDSVLEVIFVLVWLHSGWVLLINNKQKSLHRIRCRMHRLSAWYVKLVCSLESGGRIRALSVITNPSLILPTTLLLFTLCCMTVHIDIDSCSFKKKVFIKFIKNLSSITLIKQSYHCVTWEKLTARILKPFDRILPKRKLRHSWKALKSLLQGIHLQWCNCISTSCWTDIVCCACRLLTTVTKEVEAARSLPVCHSSAAPQPWGHCQSMTATLRTLALPVIDSSACPVKVQRFSNIRELSMPLSLHCFSVTYHLYS